MVAHRALTSTHAARAAARSTVWAQYLQVLVLALAALSLVLVLAPALGAEAFSLLVYQQRSFPADFSDEALDYIRLTHAVLGAVMAGWFATMFWLSRLVDRTPAAWSALAGGLTIWFVPDTVYSMASGFWENAVLNLAVIVLFVPPLVALRPGAHVAPG